MIRNYSSSYEFKVSPEEVVSRLLFATKEKANLVNGGVLRGRVTPRGMYLYKHSPLFGNIYRPVFVGKFFKKDESFLLRGHFKTFWVGKVVAGFWFIFLGLLFIFSSFSLIDKGSNGSLETTIITFIFLLVGVCMVTFSKWLSRNDRSFLLIKIEKVLSE